MGRSQTNATKATMHLPMHNVQIEQLDSSVYKIKWCFFGNFGSVLFKKLFFDHDLVFVLSCNFLQILSLVQAQTTRRNFNCSISTLCNAHHLRKHLKMHSGEKSNKCNQCNYATSDRSSLKIHLKTQWREVKQMQSM